MRAVLFVIVVILLIGGKVEAHESKSYTVENAELAGVCNAITYLIAAKMPLSSPYIQAIVTSEKRFETKDIKEAFRSCIKVIEKFQAHNGEKILQVIQEQVIDPLEQNKTTN